MIAANAGREFVLTTTLLFVVVTIVRWHVPLTVAGLLAAVLIAGLMSSPLGRRSGGHMHPGVSVFLWLTGKFPGAAVLPYVLAQLAGSVTGAALARLAWGSAVDRVGYGAVHSGLGTVPLFLAESLPLVVILAVVATWQRFVPAVIGIGVGVTTALTGASINPARQFGPALLAGPTADLWIYLAAPVLAPLLLALIVRAWRRTSPGV
jgi:glycerol uptake facilitator protein/aquaporin Z